MIGSLSGMEQRLFILLIIAGAVPLVPSIPRKYYPIKMFKSWTQAQTYCRTSYVDLATIETDADAAHLIFDSKATSFTYYAWIGLYTNISSWRWSLGNESLGNYTAWYSGFPRNRDGNDECVLLHLSGWYDELCLTTRSFVCFDASLSGNSSYIYYTTFLTWPDAQSFCRQKHTDLASVRNASEMSIIVGKIPSTYVWVGLFRDSWKWSDNTPMNNTKWIPKTPGLYNCALMDPVSGSTQSTNCLYSSQFFCYKYVTGQRKVVKMKVQMDQNVDVTAVMAAILNKIQEKLKSRGMENVSVKFKMQRDGNVFQKIMIRL